MIPAAFAVFLAFIAGLIIANMAKAELKIYHKYFLMLAKLILLLLTAFIFFTINDGFSLLIVIALLAAGFISAVYIKEIYAYHGLLLGYSTSLLIYSITFIHGLPTGLLRFNKQIIKTIAMAFAFFLSGFMVSYVINSQYVLFFVVGAYIMAVTQDLKAGPQYHKAHQSS
jgi:hypothetical protein